MYNIYTKTTGIAWIKASEKVLKEGLLIKDGEQNLKELLNVFISIEDPLSTDNIIQKYSNRKMIRWMKRNFLNKNIKNKKENEEKYNYAQRMFSFNGIDQIGRIIKKLKSNPNSKSATVTLLDPSKDQKHVPCIISIDFKIRADKLMTTAIFRSQDVYKKLYADIFAIAEINKMISKRININVGTLNIHAISLHAYESDWDMIKNILLNVHL